MVVSSLVRILVDVYYIYIYTYIYIYIIIILLLIIKIKLIIIIVIIRSEDGTQGRRDKGRCLRSSHALLRAKLRMCCVSFFLSFCYFRSETRLKPFRVWGYSPQWVILQAQDGCLIRLGRFPFYRCVVLPFWHLRSLCDVSLFLLCSFGQPTLGPRPQTLGTLGWPAKRNTEIRIRNLSCNIGILVTDPNPKPNPKPNPNPDPNDCSLTDCNMTCDSVRLVAETVCRLAKAA